MSDTHGYDSILLIGFGGPTAGCCQKYASCPSEAHCFVEGIVGTAPSWAKRVREVVSHYLALGGFSPFNALTFQQARALEAALKDRGIDVPVYAGMRHWTPYIHEVIAEMAQKGHRQILGIIMAPYQSKASWDEYQQAVSQAIKTLNGNRLTIHYLDVWYAHSGYIKAIADRIHLACKEMAEDRFDNASLVFTAHAIPKAAANASPYIHQFAETATAVASLIGKDFNLAYQSQPQGTPIPWTQPDINDLIREKAEVRDVIVSPIGFLCDHVEVLYDLDVEAKATAESHGMGFIRAGTVGAHPEFIRMLADLACDRLTDKPES
jgi:ferrochelatase